MRFLCAAARPAERTHQPSRHHMTLKSITLAGWCHRSGWLCARCLWTPIPLTVQRIFYVANINTRATAPGPKRIVKWEKCFKCVSGELMASASSHIAQRSHITRINFEQIKRKMMCAMTNAQATRPRRVAAGQMRAQWMQRKKTMPEKINFAYRPK